jgi:NADPH:quinone reductase-like Zn-dependent oxidoreductase
VRSIALSHNVMSPIPKTHPAVGLMGLRKPLGIFERPKVPPQAGEVVVHVEWTASNPFDLHQSDGGLLVDSYPKTMGDSFAGTVVQLGPPPPEGSPDYATADAQVSEKVFSFVFQKDKEKAHQKYSTVATVCFQNRLRD